MTSNHHQARSSPPCASRPFLPRSLVRGPPQRHAPTQLFWGWGPNNSRLLFLREYGIPTNSHNNVYELLINYGIIGAIFWLGYAAMYALYVLSNYKKKYFPFSLGLLCGLAIVSIVSPIYREADIYVMLGVAVLLLKSWNINNEKSDSIHK